MENKSIDTEEVKIEISENREIINILKEILEQLKTK